VAINKSYDKRREKPFLAKKPSGARVISTVVISDHGGFFTGTCGMKGWNVRAALG
jgi:hypothetical protein